ncbi:hypothetical protein HLRTI_001313 [Halorhabdus tiamatea SARL4B]|uniref:Uncharacterized protein n=1 Tax=Halorhabdus tiamatea SARL4B TaxID=1033806 RepID=U2DLG2_9EURY|nr:hypothetical protein HLRTI_001313 [Halorhabdus tiamatea SARL4B]
MTEIAAFLGGVIVTSLAGIPLWWYVPRHLTSAPPQDRYRFQCDECGAMYRMSDKDGEKR